MATASLTQEAVLAGDVPGDAVPVLPLPVPCQVTRTGLNPRRPHPAEAARAAGVPALLAKHAGTPTGPRAGTPGGVGAAREPERLFAGGDVAETGIPGIGTLRNTVRCAG